LAKKTTAKKKTTKIVSKDDRKEDKWKEVILVLVEKIRKISPNLKNKTEEEVKQEFLGMINKEYEKFPKEKYPKRTEKVYWKRTFSKFRNKYKKMLRSQAIPFVGKVLGYKPARDMMENIINKQLELAETNLSKALRDGLIMFSESEDPDTGEAMRKPVKDKFGKYIPRDTRKTFNKKDDKGNLMKNRNFGKALQSSWSMTVYLICGPEEQSGEPRYTTMDVRYAKAEPGQHQLKVPVGKNVRFLALNRTPEDMENEYYLRSSSQTEFEVLPDDHLPVTLADLFNSKIMSKIARECDNLEDYYEEYGTKEDGSTNWDLVTLTRGDVVDMSLEKTSGGNMWIRLERTTVYDDISDLDTGFGDDEDEEEADIPDSTTCWIGPHLQHLIDFAQDSVVYVLGRPNKMAERDEDGETLVDDDGAVIMTPVSITTYGLWVDPEWKEEINKEEIEDNEEEIEDEGEIEPEEEDEGDEEEVEEEEDEEEVDIEQTEEDW